MNVADLMKRYTVDYLKTITPEKFEARVREMLDKKDWLMEGYNSPEGQRTLSIDFHWGHNHDFGSFKLDGLMQNRHIKIIQWYVDNGMPSDLTDKKVMDIGAWTGGMSLVLKAMNPDEIIVLEEVVKYAETIQFLAESFGLENMGVYPESLYEFDWMNGYFDLINFSGVLYHVTDPFLALKILVDWLRIDGILAVETHVSPRLVTHEKVFDGRPLLEYVGPSKNQKLGWNWFFPNIPFLEQAMKDLGMEITAMNPGVRTLFLAKKVEDKPIMTCGFSKEV